jgi:hypothetical protein
MNEVCIESCNPARDTSGFEMKKGMDLPDLPRFPLDEFLNSMTAEERKTIMAVYMAKTTDYLQGVRDEPRIIKRSNPNHSRTFTIPENLQGETILFSAKEEVASLEVGPEHSSADERPKEVARSTD